MNLSTDASLIALIREANPQSEALARTQTHPHTHSMSVCRVVFLKVLLNSILKALWLVYSVAIAPI